MNVKANITQATAQEKNKTITLTGDFKVQNLGCKRTKTEESLYMILEKPYTKDDEIKAVGLRFDDCKVFMSESQQQQPELEEAEEETEGQLEI